MYKEGNRPYSIRQHSRIQNIGFFDKVTGVIPLLTGIMQHFVSDHAIYHEGAIYTPMWFYWHTPEKYAEVGITPEMVEEHLEILAKFEFTEEADEAFSEKRSEFIGEEVSLREIRNRRRGNRRE